MRFILILKNLNYVLIKEKKVTIILKVTGIYNIKNIIL